MSKLVEREKSIAEVPLFSYINASWGETAFGRYTEAPRSNKGRCVAPNKLDPSAARCQRASRHAVDHACIYDSACINFKALVIVVSACVCGTYTVIRERGDRADEYFSSGDISARF